MILIVDDFHMLEYQAEMERFHWKMKILEVGILVTKLF